MSIKATHTWTLGRTNGTTRVKTAESLEGPIARLLRRPLQRMLQKTLDPGVQTLKAEVERLASAPAAGEPR